MNLKLIVTVALFLFVAVSVGTMFVQESRKTLVATPSDAVPTIVKRAPTATGETGIDVIYFHGNLRCPTCRRIEAYAQEAVETRFADHLARGDVSWQVVNYEQPENANYLDDFQLVAPTVVVVQRRNGRQGAWQNLDRVWELVGDQAAFTAYIQQGIDSHLKEGTDE